MTVIPLLGVFFVLRGVDVILSCRPWGSAEEPPYLHRPSLAVGLLKPTD